MRGAQGGQQGHFEGGGVNFGQFFCLFKVRGISLAVSLRGIHRLCFLEELTSRLKQRIQFFNGTLEAGYFFASSIMILFVVVLFRVPKLRGWGKSLRHYYQLCHLVVKDFELKELRVRE